MQKIYVISSQKGGAKVGIAKNPNKRLGSMKTGTPVPISLFFQSDARSDARIVESLSHQLLLEKHIQGEWFDVTPEEAEVAIRRAIEMVDSGEFIAQDKGKSMPSRVGPAKTTAQRVREAEAMHKARGERQIKLWVPKDATEDELQALRNQAAALCDKYLKQSAVD